MKILRSGMVGCLVAIGGFASQVTAAPMRGDMRCSDFMSLTEVQRPKVVYWAEGAKHKGRPQDAIIDVTSVDRVVPIIVEQCSAAPQASFWAKLDASWKKLEASVNHRL